MGRRTLRRTAIGLAVVPAVMLLCLAQGRASFAGPGQVAQAGNSVRLHAGWNLIAAPPGSAVPSHAGPLYTQPARQNDYNIEPLPDGSDFNAGWGYWIYLAADGDLKLGAGQSAFSIIVPAGRWVLAGNPSGTGTATIMGADVAYAYDPAAGYTAVTALQPGQAAWVFSAGGATVRLSVGPLQTVTAF